MGLQRNVTRDLLSSKVCLGTMKARNDNSLRLRHRPHQPGAAMATLSNGIPRHCHQGSRRLLKEAQILAKEAQMLVKVIEERIVVDFPSFQPT
jgi:hypothetical protein